MLFILFFLQENASHADGQVKGGEIILEEAPQPTYPFPKDISACWDYTKRHIQRPKQVYRTYPQTVDEAVKWLLEARRRGRLHLQKGAILGRLQSEIDQHQKGDLYLFFGNNHTVVKHYQFFNELLQPGKDGLYLSGLTHLALEAFVTDHESKPFSRRMLRWLRKIWGKDQRRLLRDPQKRQHLAKLLLTSQQPLIDLYIQRKQAWAYRLLKIVNRFLLGRSYPLAFLREVEKSLQHARHYPGGHLDVVATDMSLKLRQRFYHVFCWIYPLREVFSLQMVQRRIQKVPATRRVIAYMWGADHIRKQHFPRYLPKTTSTFSIRLGGGSRPDLWDLAFARLGWDLGTFALETSQAEEADLLIHFPPKGRWNLAGTQIQQVALARLLRKSQGSRWPEPNPFPITYRNNVLRVLQLLQPRLDRCHRHGHASLDLQLHVSPTGRIKRTIIQKNPFHAWSEQCVRLVLWRYPLPPPPKGTSIKVQFSLRRKRVKGPR
ncbi:MAG: hypothetical protein H6727_02445 [Myxococcales bacterium]|nr:hypothetical protein [Myxococcales bacterium]